MAIKSRIKKIISKVRKREEPKPKEKLFTPAPVFTPSPKKFAGPVRPTTDIQTFRRTGISRPAQIPKLESQLKKAGLPKEQARAVSLSEKLRLEAKTRKRGFTGREARKFLGGAKGVRALREARRRGVTSKLISDIRKGEIKKKEVFVRPLGTVTTVPKVKGLEGLSRRLQQRRDLELTKKQRLGKVQFTRGDIKIAGLELAKAGVDTTIAIKSLKNAPRKIIESAKDPKNLVKTIKGIPGEIKASGKEFGRILKISPSSAIVFIGTQVLLLKGSGKVFKVAGKFKPATQSKFKEIIKKEQLKPTNVQFIGVQRQSGNKVITQVVFKTDQGKVGGAIGLSVQKGKRSQTLVIGRAAKVKKNGKKAKIKDIESFIGIEKGISREKKLILRAEIEGIGTVTKNIRAINQVGVGRTAQAPGKKLMIKIPGTRINKKVTGLRVKDFASVSNVLTKKDISLIVGRTITSDKDLINFVGIIRGAKGSAKTFNSLSPAKKQLYKKALQDVASVVSANSKQSAKVIPKLSMPARKRIVNKFLPKTKIKKLKKLGLNQKEIQKVLGRSVAGVRFRQSLRVASREKSRLKIREKTRQAEILREKALLKQKISLKLKKVTKKKVKLIGIRPSVRVGRGVLAPKLTAIKKNGIKGKKKKAPKGKQGFDVFAKSRGKTIKLNKKPLSRLDAERRGAFAIDHSTSRTLSFKPSKTRVKTLGKITKKERQGFSKTKPKLRSFRIKKGKKITLGRKLIEKRKFLIDTRGEKKGLQISKLAKQQGWIGSRSKSKVSKIKSKSKKK